MKRRKFFSQLFKAAVAVAAVPLSTLKSETMSEACLVQSGWNGWDVGSDVPICGVDVFTIQSLHDSIQRLHAKLKETDDIDEMRAITYAIGYFCNQLTKLLNQKIKLCASGNL